jgi:hypothetical protein
MASTDLSRRVGKVVGYQPLSKMSEQRRREFHEALLEAETLDDLTGEWQAAILDAEESRPKLRVVRDDSEAPSEVRVLTRSAGRGVVKTRRGRNPDPARDWQMRALCGSADRDSTSVDLGKPRGHEMAAR